MISEGWLTRQIVREGSHPSEVAKDGSFAPTLVVASARSGRFDACVYCDKSPQEDPANDQ
jgi:hypothetical protein